MPFPNSTRSNDSRRDDTRDTRKSGTNNGGRHGDPERHGSSRLTSVLRDLNDSMAELRGQRDTSEREETLKRQNFQLRRRNARLSDELDEMSNGGSVPEGSRVITDAEFTELEEFRKLQLKPADLVKVVEEHGTLKKTEGERAAEQALTDALEAIEVPNIAAGVKLLRKEGLIVEFRDVRETVGGKRQIVRVPHVRKADNEKAEWVPLVDYIEDELPEFVPSLMAEQASEDGHSESEEDEGAGGTVRRTLRRQGDDSGEGAASDNEQGEPVAMRRIGSPRSTARASSQGVAVAATRGARTPGSGTTRVSDDKLYEQKRNDSSYSL